MRELRGYLLLAPFAIGMGCAETALEPSGADDATDETAAQLLRPSRVRAAPCARAGRAVTAQSPERSTGIGPRRRRERLR